MNYNSMKATKSTSTKKPTSNWNISRSTSKKAQKAAKKVNANWFVVLLVLVVGLTAGFFAHYYLFKSDTFEMVAANGVTDIELGLDDGMETSYTELGVKCICFGKDYSKDCTVKYYYRTDLTEDAKEVTISDINTSNPGMFYAVYTTTASKYSSVTLIRNILVTGGEK